MAKQKAKAGGAKADKDKTKKGSSSKSKAAKLPKTVAGVRLPESVRSASAFTTLFNSDLGREILADALIAAAGAAAAALTRTRPSARQMKQAGENVVEAGSDAAAATRDAVQTAAGAVAGVVSDAARSILPASLVGEEHESRGEPGPDGRPSAVADRPGKQGKGRDRPGKR